MKVFLGYNNGGIIWQTKGEILSLEEAVELIGENYIEKEMDNE